MFYLHIKESLRLLSQPRKIFLDIQSRLTAVGFNILDEDYISAYFITFKAKYMHVWLFRLMEHYYIQSL